MNKRESGAMTIKPEEIPNNVGEFIELLRERGLLAENGQFAILFPVHLYSQPMFEGDIYQDHGVCRYELVFPHARRNLFFTSEEAARLYIKIAQSHKFTGNNNSSWGIEPPDFEKGGWLIFKRVEEKKV